MTELDPFGRDQVLAAPEVVEPFNRAQILSAADVHGAVRLARLCGCDDPLALLAAAFAIRAPRFGHVCAELASLSSTVTGEDGRAVELPDEAWPDTDRWLAAIKTSPMNGRALRLEAGRLYLDRYHSHERSVATAIRDRMRPPAEVDVHDLPGLNDEQRAAVATAARSPLSVIAGGPGTGKTSTVAHVIEQFPDDALVAVAAPTGKAAARLGEAIREQGHLTKPMTLHRLLGYQRRNTTRFFHDAGNPLPHDLVIVDETSMVPLSMFTRLLEAMRPDAHLLLLGDPDQLTAVEAGNVLGDLLLAAQRGGPLAGCVTQLVRNYRSNADVQALAAAVRDGQADEALAQLLDPEVQHVRLVVPDQPGDWPRRTGVLEPIADLLAERAVAAMAHARDGDLEASLRATTSAKVLCAHRRGPDGVRAWNGAIEGWATDLPSYRRPEWYAGRPVMIRRNDPDLDIFNGDLGVVVNVDGAMKVVVDGRDGDPVDVRRISDVQTVHALTVHKSQGSQFDDVVVVLPEEASPVLTRQLLYTAITRARDSVTIIGTEQALRHTVSREVSRASGLAGLLS